MSEKTISSPPQNGLQMDRLIKLLEAILTNLKSGQPILNAAKAPPSPAQTVPRNSEKSEIIGSSAATSISNYKELTEIWDKVAYGYKIVDPVTAPVQHEEDGYLFVVRTRIDKETKFPSLFFDIKLPALQQMLSTVLRDVRGVSVQEDRPTVEGNILFHFLPELKIYRDSVAGDGYTQIHQLDVMLECIEREYSSTVERLRSLLERNEITYDLLWALFKPNSDIYTTCPGTEQSMCVRFNHGEEQKSRHGPDFYSLEVRYFDYDGKVFGEATGTIEITKFRGAKRIDSLAAYPLQLHRDPTSIRSELIEYGRLFVSLAGVNHKQYQGLAFKRDEKLGIVKVSVKGRIMVDPKLMRRMNPNYRKPAIETYIDLWGGVVCNEVQQEGVIRGANWNKDELTPENLLICSPTVQGFSLNDKQWLEFAVADIEDIAWNGDVLAQLSLPAKQKEVVNALCTAHLTQQPGYQFDDFVAGKGSGLSILLHGPPGVGKTMTAEAMSEHLQRPLYSISAGELGISASTLETRLSDIFTMAGQWSALLLLDEADVYVEQRAPKDLDRNELVCVFLRKLEYYQGILILTTNRVTTIDEAVASRIHLALPYRQLDESARRAVWSGFLEKVKTGKGAAKCKKRDLETLSRYVLNGREIKNAVSTARALAMNEDMRMSLQHAEEAIQFNQEFQADFRGADQIENLHAYQ